MDEFDFFDQVQLFQQNRANKPVEIAARD